MDLDLLRSLLHNKSAYLKWFGEGPRTCTLFYQQPWAAVSVGFTALGRKEGRKDAETTWQIHARSNSLDNNHCPPDEISGVISSLLHLFEVSSQLNMPATPFQADDQESSWPKALLHSSLKTASTSLHQSAQPWPSRSPFIPSSRVNVRYSNSAT